MMPFALPLGGCIGERKRGVVCPIRPLQPEQLAANDILVVNPHPSNMLTIVLVPKFNVIKIASRHRGVMEQTDAPSN